MTFNHDTASFDDWDQRAVDKLIFEEGQGQFILRAHLFIERILDTAIKRALAHPDRLYSRNRPSFEFKVDLARSLGVLPERLVSAIRALNSLRNNVAHSEDLTLSPEQLKRLRVDWTSDQGKAFRGALRKSLVEGERIACLFLAWRCIHLVAKVSPPLKGDQRRADQ